MAIASLLRLRPLATLAILASVLTAVLLIAASPAPAVPRAHIDGSRAVAPKGAPRVVKKMIRAGNRIRHKRYKWGGGHGDWKDKGYDCSGAVSYVLHKAGLLDYPLTSGGFMKWGAKRRGRWVSIFANKEHVFMTVAGLRFDTSYITDGDRSGPGWSEYMRPAKGFRTRHPRGL
ncbi:MAG TPA: hypothetical protein VFH44_04400 [Solirubrobacterales bacterium]|nr:hypothetical protein [Solirubrobacterales bacterium]